jgi:hypothetical protein
MYENSFVFSKTLFCTFGREGQWRERRIHSSVVPYCPAFARFAPCMAGVALGLGLAGRAQACPIEVVGGDRTRWLGAAAVTTAAVSGDGGRGCASVVVETAAGGAVLRLVARDGRLAVRELREPVELLPAVQALTVPISEPRDEPERHRSPEKPPPAKARKLEPNEPERANASDPYATRPLVGAAFGFRVGADRLITPTLGGSLSLLQGPLELGVLARYEAHYVNSTGGNEARPETSGLAFGTQFGVHRVVEPLTLRGGLLLLVVALREENDGQRGRAEARIGGYLGAVWPARGKLRVRCDLALDIVPYNVGRSETNALGDSSLPWWGVGFSFGLEAG